MTQPRRLGRSGIRVSPMGLGLARLAGLGWDHEAPTTIAPDARREGVRQIEAAIDAGVTLFDTADNYGGGESERILGEAVRSRRDGVVVVTKFGEDPEPGQADPWALDAGTIERKCGASLRRLGLECIDLYLLHRRDYPLERAPEMVGLLEDLVRHGWIRHYGWSTDDVERARVFARGEHCTAIEHRLNVLQDAPAMLELCREHDLASLNRVPLLMGVLTGRWSAATKLEVGDPRAAWFEQGSFLDLLARAREIEPQLTLDGRSVAQGALAWIWARSPLTVPLPGFRDMTQVRTLIEAQRFGPLPPDAMRAIAERVQINEP
jgi:aryl-alcohol dehydrogenase-like predicted oxidoreductase